MAPGLDALMGFPCEYTIKVLGREAPDFAEWVLAVVSRHATVTGEVDARPSRAGRFVSINVSFIAESQGQLERMHAELQAGERVALIL